MRYSDDYKRQCEKLHQEDPAWGSGPKKRIRRIYKWLIDENIGGDLLDYGCGKGALSGCMDIPVTSYDPMVSEFSKLPEPHRYMVCCDVLEHVEPAYLDEVLQHMADVTLHQAYVYVSGVPAKETLPDGRNAHLIQEDWHWWTAKIEHYFRIQDIENNWRGGTIVGTGYFLGKK